VIHLQTFFQLYCIASKENGVIIVNDDDDVGMWKEADVDYFMVIFQNLPGRSEENQSRSPGRDPKEVFRNRSSGWKWLIICTIRFKVC